MSYRQIFTVTKMCNGIFVKGLLLKFGTESCATISGVCLELCTNSGVF